VGSLLPVGDPKSIYLLILLVNVSTIGSVDSLQQPGLPIIQTVGLGFRLGWDASAIQALRGPKGVVFIAVQRAGLIGGPRFLNASRLRELRAANGGAGSREGVYARIHVFLLLVEGLEVFAVVVLVLMSSSYQEE